MKWGLPPTTKRCIALVRCQQKTHPGCSLQISSLSSVQGGPLRSLEIELWHKWPYTWVPGVMGPYYDRDISPLMTARVFLSYALFDTIQRLQQTTHFKDHPESSFGDFFWNKSHLEEKPPPTKTWYPRFFKVTFLSTNKMISDLFSRRSWFPFISSPQKPPTQKIFAFWILGAFWDLNW